MDKEQSTGIIFFAYNTDQINYLKLATLSALYAEKYMPRHNRGIITSKEEWEWFKTTREGKLAEQVFDDVILAPPPNQKNLRMFYDSPYSRFKSNFKNGNKHKVFEYSPYDKTLMVDIDYIIQNDFLDYVFDSDEGVALFHHAEDIAGNKPHVQLQYLHPTGIPMLWSTVIYFDRHNPVAKLFFDLWAHIAESYDFYRFLYGFPEGLFRTDFCVSIATHILNGMGNGNVIADFPKPMIFSTQKDDIVKINEVDEWVHMVNDRIEDWKDTLTLIKKENVHVMNKRSLERQYDAILEKLGKKIA